MLHSVSAPAELVERALAAGFYIGFTGPITYKNADQTRRIAAAAPAGTDPCRDRWPVSDAGSAPWQAQRASIHPPDRRTARVGATSLPPRRSPKPQPPTPSACSGSRS
ncbi:MAG: hypothetical protein HND48_07235 [Chloroflexi bacterium]|nr:hypothetical protein [Chloroflexota bacterium]